MNDNKKKQNRMNHRLETLKIKDKPCADCFL